MHVVLPWSTNSALWHDIPFITNAHITVPSSLHPSLSCNMALPSQMVHGKFSGSIDLDEDWRTVAFVTVSSLDALSFSSGKHALSVYL